MSAGRDIGFSCRCGTVRGTLHDITPAAGTHARCSCRDCRDAPRWIGEEPHDPAQLFQTTPDRVSFETGHDRLAAYCWRKPGLVRWYATCCNSLLFNSSNSPKMAFVSAHVGRVDTPEAFGPVIGHAFIDAGNGKQRHEGLGRFIWRMIKRTSATRLSGRWKQTPFFDVTTGDPITPVTHLTKPDRDKARANA